MKAYQLLGHSNFSLFTSRTTRDRIKFERIRASTCGYLVFELVEYASELPRKFISFHCLENEYNELTDSNPEGVENFPELPQRIESDVGCVSSHESPEKRIVDSQVMPVGEVHKESAEESM